MAKAEPIPLKMSNTGLLHIIRQLARDSANVYFTAHARQRMKQRQISNSQVLACLRRGDIYERKCHVPLH